MIFIKYPKYHLIFISRPHPFYADRRGTKKKNLLKTNGPINRVITFIICVKIIIVSATRFAAFRAEKEEREKETPIRLLIFFTERERESFRRAIIVSQRRDLNKMYQII